MRDAPVLGAGSRQTSAPAAEAIRSGPPDVPTAAGLLTAVAATLRAAGAELGRLAASSVGLLDSVLALDHAETWLSPWQRRSTARIDGWREALDFGARVMGRRIRWYEQAASWFEERAGGLGGSGPPAPGAGAGPSGPAPIGAGWDDVEPRLLRVVTDDLVDLAAGDPAVGYPGTGLRAGPSGDVGRPVAGRGDAGRGDAGRGEARRDDVGGLETVWFDPGRLVALAERLRAAGDTARGMAAAIARVEDRVARSGAGPLLAEPVRLPGLPIPTDALRLGTHAVALGAPELAAGITRRMAHFAAAADAVRTGGVLIDVPAWFDDAPPIQLAQVRRTGADLVRLIGTDPDALRAATVGEIGDRLAGLTPATRQAVISRLRGAPLAVLAGAVRRLTGRRGTVSTADLATVAALPDLLLAGAPAAMLDEIVRILPDLEPTPPSRPGAPADPDDPHDVGAGSRDSRDDPVIRSGISPSDVGQGGVEDCYLAAALVGVALQNPRILADGIRENPNGTLTVTFYGRRGGGGGGGGGAGGRPFPVTVTRRLPVSDGPIPIAMDQHDLLGRPEDWPAGYEKAYARANGGYDAISGGDAGVAASQLTGYPHRTVAPAVLPVAEIRARLDAGDVVTVSTRDRPQARDGTGLVGRHAYTVVGADVAGGRVLLRNPWAHPGTQLLTWYDWDALRPGLHSAALTPTR